MFFHSVTLSMVLLYKVIAVAQMEMCVLSLQGCYNLVKDISLWQISIVELLCGGMDHNI